MAIGIRAVKLSMVVALTVLTMSLSGCLLAAAAGVGGGVHMTGHTAEAIVDKPVAQMATAAERVLGEEKIRIDASSTEESGSKRTYEGKQGDLAVRITVEREGVTGSKIGVSAQRSAVTWDDEYAKTVLAKIIG